MTDRADNLDRIERWLHAHEAIEAASHIGIKRPSVTFDDFATFQRLFGGEQATAERHASGGWTDWKIEKDGIRFSCTEYHPGRMQDEQVQSLVPTLAGDVPQAV